MKLDLLTNAAVVDDDNKFVTEKAEAAANAGSKADTPLIKLAPKLSRYVSICLKNNSSIGYD
jgi:hypothetical protein